MKIIQELYEKKLVTYPRTDARVLSTAVAKEIHRNIGGLRNFAPLADFAANALENGNWKQIARTKYVNDKQITDTTRSFRRDRDSGHLEVSIRWQQKFMN